MGDTIHSISASIQKPWYKNDSASSAEPGTLCSSPTNRNLQLQTTAWPLMTTDDHWVVDSCDHPLSCTIDSKRCNAKCQAATFSQALIMALKQMRSRRTAKSVINCQGSLVDLDIFYAFFGLQDIAGYCRILQDYWAYYWASSLLYCYYSYPTHLAFLKCARADRHETIWSTWRELVEQQGSLGTLCPSKTSSWSLGFLSSNSGSENRTTVTWVVYDGWS